MIGNEVTVLLKKELLLEWRQKYALNGILLYLISTVFIVYLGFEVSLANISPETWNTLFWIILLFTAVNAVAKSFMQESEGRMIYLYQTASPQAIIISKQLYNSGLMIILGLLGFLIFSLIFGNIVGNASLFILDIILAGIGFSLTLTLLSGIASKAGNNVTLMAVLSFPVVLPILLLVINIAYVAVSGGSFESTQKDLLVLLAVDAILGAVSYILFPYLWRS